MIATHLPALQVVIPLLAAPLCLLLHRGPACWALSLAVSWTALAIALTLLGQVLSGGPISYPIGGWAPPWGIEYRLDTLGGFVLVIVAAIGAVVIVFARLSVAHEVAGDRQYLFYALYLLCLTGMLGIVITGDVFNLFVFLEIFSLAAYAMVALGRDRRALTAAFQYLVMGTIGATFYVIGVGLLYMMTGTLNMADLAQRLPQVAETRTILVALAFLTVGMSLKLALFPLHLWLPNAYCYAPSMVTTITRTKPPSASSRYSMPHGGAQPPSGYEIGPSLNTRHRSVSAMASAVQLTARLSAQHAGPRCKSRHNGAASNGITTCRAGRCVSIKALGPGRGSRLPRRCRRRRGYAPPAPAPTPGWRPRRRWR